jgi:hypothetical protein
MRVAATVGAIVLAIGAVLALAIPAAVHQPRSDAEQDLAEPALAGA